MSKLAIDGGSALAPPGTFAPWPHVTDADERYVLASLRGSDHSYGPNCKLFAQGFAEWNGNRHAINTNSGTAALHMCVAAVGATVGDEIIVPAYSWSSSATAILHHSCIPVFVDIDWQTMNVDASTLEAAISSHTRAIMAVHLHGLSADMAAVRQVAEAHGLFVIEDACQSHGAQYNAQNVGTLGDCAAFSFNQNKSLCSGEGGMFVTNDDALLQRAQQLWSFGENRVPGDPRRDSVAHALGWMYRASDLQAAFGRSQLRRINAYVKRQRDNAAHLTALLSNTPEFIVPIEPESCRHTYATYTLRLDMAALKKTESAASFRDRFVVALRAEGLGNGVGQWQRFILPEMPVFVERNAFGNGHPWTSPYAREICYEAADYPVAKRHCGWSFGISTPLRYPNGDKAVTVVHDCLLKVLDNLR